jgi:hypothetical protein
MSYSSLKIRPISGAGKVNPSPRLMKDLANQQAEEELQMIIDGILGEEYLMEVTQQSDLSTVDILQIQVNSSYQSLLDLNNFLPNLRELVLDSSTIVSIRDLGVGLRQLTTLSLNDCGLTDLDGIGVLTGLVKLSLMDNLIADVAPLAMHENIEDLNLNSNKLSDISIADALSSCPNLHSLQLALNPICQAPHYRLVIASLIGNLKILDGLPVDPTAQKKVTSIMILEAASAMSALAEEREDEVCDIRYQAHLERNAIYLYICKDIFYIWI